MKRVLIITLLFFALFSFAQEPTENQKEEVTKESKKVFSFGLSTGYKTFLGNNFLAKTYTNNLPLCIDARFNIYKSFGLGVYYSFNSASLKTTEYVGNSVEANFKEWGFYVAYFMPITKKILFVPRIGIGTFSMKNKLNDETFNSGFDYYTTGTTYFIAPEIDYFLTPDISLLLNLEYGYIALPNVKASDALGTNYDSSSELFIGVGINFWF